MSEVKTLVKKAQEGDKLAFEKLIACKRKEILFVALRYSGNASDAEDYAQEAIINAYKDIGRLRNLASFDSWLYGVVKNTCNYGERKMKRNKNVHTAYFEEEDALNSIEEERVEFLPIQYIESKEKRSLVLSLIDSLKKNYQECLFLYYFEELSYDEIASVLKVSKKKVANDLDRARRALKAMLEEKNEEAIPYRYGVAGALPVLTQIFSNECNEVITNEMSARLLDFTHNFVAANAVGSAAVGGVAATSVAATSSTGATGAAVTGALSTKIALGLTSVVAVAGVGVGVFAATQEISAAPDQIPIELAEDEPSTIEVAQNQEPFNERQEATIDSLPDMIGVDQEKSLLVFEQEGVDMGEWIAFLKAIGAEKDSFAGVQDGTEYTMYVLEKQDKQLLLVEQKLTNSSVVQVRHVFGSTAPIPDMIEIVFLFDG